MSLTVPPLIPLVTTDDVMHSMNGTYDSGSSNYYFWETDINSGSILAQINLANYYLYGALGISTMTSTDQVTMLHVRACELAYSCMRVLVVLSGGVITDGFNFSAGISLQQPNVLLAWKNLIANFKDMAELHFRIIQPIGLLQDADSLCIGSPAPPVM